MTQLGAANNALKEQLQQLKSGQHEQQKTAKMSESLYTRQVQGISAGIKSTVEQGDAALQTEFVEDLKLLTSIKYGLAADLDLAAQSVQLLQRQVAALVERVKANPAKQGVASPKPASTAQAQDWNEQLRSLSTLIKNNGGSPGVDDTLADLVGAIRLILARNPEQAKQATLAPTSADTQIEALQEIIDNQNDQIQAFCEQLDTSGSLIASFINLMGEDRSEVTFENCQEMLNALLE